MQYRNIICNDCTHNETCGHIEARRAMEHELMEKAACMPGKVSSKGNVILYADTLCTAARLKEVYGGKKEADMG